MVSYNIFYYPWVSHGHIYPLIPAPCFYFLPWCCLERQHCPQDAQPSCILLIPFPDIFDVFPSPCHFVRTGGAVSLQCPARGCPYGRWVGSGPERSAPGAPWPRSVTASAPTARPLRRPLAARAVPRGRVWAGPGGANRTRPARSNGAGAALRPARSERSGAAVEEDCAQVRAALR